MKYHRFIISTSFKLGEQITLYDRTLVHQLSRVLRLKNGDKIIIADGKGLEGICEITQSSKDNYIVSVNKLLKSKKEYTTPVVLYASIVKRENFEFIVEKVTEIGVSEIIPIISERTVKLNIKLERAQTIAREASEQSGRGMVPIVREPKKLETAIISAKQRGGDIVVFDPSAEKSFKSISFNKKKKPIHIFIGPEGGWSETELFSMKHNGSLMVHLEGFILRAETAAIVTSALVTYRLSE